MNTEQLFLTSHQLASRWNLKDGTLRVWRINGAGPPWLKMGPGHSARILYRMSDVERWEQDQTVDPSAEAR